MSEPTLTTEPTEATTTPPTTEPTTPTEEARFTQAEVDSIVKQRLERAKTKAQTEAQKAADEARQKALAEQGEFQRLAEERAKQLAELQPKVEQIEAMEAALTAHVEAAKKGVAPHILELLESMPLLKQMEYLAKNADKLKPQSISTNGATARTTQQTEAEKKAREEELRRRYRIY